MTSIRINLSPDEADELLNHVCRGSEPLKKLYQQLADDFLKRYESPEPPCSTPTKKP
jgi:hypothetical protein